MRRRTSLGLGVLGSLTNPGPAVRTKNASIPDALNFRSPMR